MVSEFRYVKWKCRFYHKVEIYDHLLATNICEKVLMGAELWLSPPEENYLCTVRIVSLDEKTNDVYVVQYFKTTD